MTARRSNLLRFLHGTNHQIAAMRTSDTTMMKGMRSQDPIINNNGSIGCWEVEVFAD
jgi:hypothetical protein